jgi:two-component system response regulator FimZ (fimbrial Z protein)
MKKLSVLIVDDEVLIRQGLRAILEKEPFVGSIYEAGTKEEFNSRLDENVIDLILLDIRLRKTSGLELLKLLKKIDRRPKVIAVTGLEGVELIVNLLKAGCDGIVYKLDGYKEILKTIEAILDGKHYLPDRVRKIIQSNAKRWDKTPVVVLSFQEMELVRAIANGLTTKQMAADLKLKPATAETYRIRLLKKIGVPNTASLLAYAYRNGIL